MPNIEKDHEVTHYACFEMFAKNKEKTECCYCTGHICLRDRDAAAIFNLDVKTHYANEIPSTSNDISS